MSKKKFSRKNEWKQSRIDKKNHIRPEYHLIVTEGKKTEPNYFTGFKELINQNG